MSSPTGPANTGTANSGDGWAHLGAPAGLCESCAHGKLNATNRGTAYLRCTRAAWDDRLPRYPRLPVRDCVGYEQPAS
jgi:hypothetical protein